MIPYNPTRHITPCAVYISSPNARDTFSRSGAHELAAEIQAWWHTRGFTTVRAWAEEAYGRGKVGHIFVVRSNLVAGLPPKPRVEQVYTKEAWAAVFPPEEAA